MGQKALKGKKIILDEVRPHQSLPVSFLTRLCVQNGWPYTTGSGVQANTRLAVASMSNTQVSSGRPTSPSFLPYQAALLTACCPAQAYFDLLDSKCSYFKETNNGIGWFGRIYLEDMEPEYGILDDSGKLNFPFSPRTLC